MRTLSTTSHWLLPYSPSQLAPQYMRLVRSSRASHRRPALCWWRSRPRRWQWRSQLRCWRPPSLGPHRGERCTTRCCRLRCGDGTVHLRTRGLGHAQGHGGWVTFRTAIGPPGMTELMDTATWLTSCCSRTTRALGAPTQEWSCQRQSSLPSFNANCEGMWHPCKHALVAFAFPFMPACCSHLHVMEALTGLLRSLLLHCLLQRAESCCTRSLPLTVGLLGRKPYSAFSMTA
mmetsp:Transcript_63539/g.176154  ORF Transcript_63539/g.176154 Transcript_63539/m.176154 type:complete len:232 (-) Transcript_63539:361-1056(-)